MNYPRPWFVRLWDTLVFIVLGVVTVIGTAAWLQIACVTLLVLICVVASYYRDAAEDLLNDYRKRLVGSAPLERENR